ncbi:VanZ like family [Allocoprococcus comes]|nr:VanZ like family [Coprococcus comes]
MEECHSDMVSEIQRECILSEVVFLSFCDLTYSVPNPVKPSAVDDLSDVMGGWGIWETVNGEQKLTTECIENVIMMVPFSVVVMWTFEEKMEKGWKKILWYSGKIAFIFSISIEMLQLLLRLGTFQLSDIFYNTVGGVLGGVCYCGIMKVRKRL